MNRPLIIIASIIILAVSEFILGFLAGKCHEISSQIKRDLRDIGKGRAK